MDQYLHWDSNHFITGKNSVFNTLAFRSKVVCSNQHTLQEMDHIRKAFFADNFPPWALNSLHRKFNHMHNINNTQTLGTNITTPTIKDPTLNISFMVPQTKGLEEMFKETCNSLGIQVHFKGNNTIRTLLMAPKDKDNKCQKSGVIYQFQFPHINCPEKYIGESDRPFGDRLKEHLRA